MRGARNGALALMACALLASGCASAGSTSGFGATRTAHLSDAGNGVAVSVVCPETMSGITGFSFQFSLIGSAGTAAAAYTLAVVVSPGRDVEARWSGNTSVPAGAANTSAPVVIPAEALPFTAPNTPFSIELSAANGTLLDSVDFSVDLRYREPPPDGGLLALSLASASVWGIVFLYALNLHLAQRKLRAKVDALASAQTSPSAGGQADGEKR